MDPRDNLGYLLHHLTTTLDRQSDQVLSERLGIGFSQFKILMALGRKDRCAQRDIAAYLGQTEASISRQIKLLIEKGLLQSRTSPTSRRERVTTLTAKGEALMDKAMQVLNNYHGPMFAKLSDKQKAQLTETLDTMHEHACQINCGCHH
jgi:DNA-binding MarR family transcriptional regulator